MSPRFYNILSSALFIAHLIGFLWVVWGGWYLLKGVKGQGQSVEGIRALKLALLDLFKPVVWGGLALLSLLVLTFWDHSPLTILIQGIAPLSTMIWVIWSHFSARRVDPGEMFEALVPLSPPRVGRGSVPEHFHQSAEAWSNQHHPLNARALTQTALQAIDDSHQHYQDRKPLSFDDLTMVLRDALADTKEACQRFPLGQNLTLADWFYEGERLTEIWTQGLSSIERGRALINPLTLIDNKKLWSWSKGSPQHLFEHELSAWLHHGLYLLVIRRITELQDEKSGDQRDLSQPSSTSTNNVQREVPKLWQMMTRKITVPFWLYWSLGSVAVSINHGLVGVVLSVSAGGLLWVSLDRATSIKRWRERFTALGSLHRPHRVGDHELNTQVHRLVQEQVETLKVAIDDRPVASLLQFAQETSSGIAMIYRRPEHPEPPLALLNATIVDALYTLELICDDLIKWRNSGGIIQTIIGLLSKFGVDDQQIEQMLLDTARDWANGAKEGAKEGVEEGEITTSLIDDSPSLFERAELADTWLNREVAELNFVFRAAAILALSQVKSRVQDWVSDELTSRIIPLYQGAVGQNLDHDEQRLISSTSSEFADISEISKTSQ
jgi:hypothetical protein